MTLPTKSNSEYPNLLLDAFENKLCNLNRSKIERKRETNYPSVFPYTIQSSIYISHIWYIDPVNTIVAIIS